MTTSNPFPLLCGQTTPTSCQKVFCSPSPFALVTTKARCDGDLLMVFSPLLIGRIIAADAISSHAIRAGLSKARSGIEGIFSSFWVGTRNARKFREPTFGLTRRACQDRHRPCCEYVVLQKQRRECQDSQTRRNVCKQTEARVAPRRVK